MQAVAVALSLPEDGESGIGEKVSDEMKIETLNADGGFDSLVPFMDENLGKDDLANSLEKFEDLENYYYISVRLDKQWLNTLSTIIRITKESTKMD